MNSFTYFLESYELFERTEENINHMVVCCLALTQIIPPKNSLAPIKLSVLSAFEKARTIDRTRITIQLVREVSEDFWEIITRDDKLFDQYENLFEQQCKEIDEKNN